ncbi:MAG: glycosyltransferase [Acetivibrionales bacterium]|jgi:cellulose synthase/poly-beta-1,6-N-acetylglucosamine synthase-like glycosyltransferase
MLESVVQFVVFFLAIYGVFTLIMGLKGLITQKIDIEDYKTKLVIMVKDQEETIEGIIRTIFMESFLRKVLSNDKLIVIDMGSKDKTREILEKLKREYEYIEVLNENQKDRVFAICSDE